MGKASATLTVIAVSLALAACSAAPDGHSDQTVETGDAAAGQADATKPAGKEAALPAAVPKLSYRFQLSYRLEGDAIARTQDKHLALCRELGPDRCQLVAMERTAKDEGFPTASLKLRVATSVAPEFETQLGSSVTAAGGRAIDTHVAADDVSKQIVDTQARIRQRELLVERTTEILRQRGGNQSELAETERNVTQAQEELDQARTWLAELQGRVAMSDFDIHYEAVSATRSQGVAGNLAESASWSFSTFSAGMQAIFAFLIFLAPWGLLGAAIFWVIHRVRRRWFATAG